MVYIRKLMQLVERHIIKPTHRFYGEIDRLSFLTKNLYNAANYIYRQNFFAGKRTDATAVYHALKDTVDYKAIPAKVASDVLRRLFRAWQSYYASIIAYQKDPDSFKASPSIPKYKGTPGNRSDGRYVVGYNYQAVSKKALKKGLANPSKTNIYVPTSVNYKIDEIRLIPRTGCYYIEIVYTREDSNEKLPGNHIAAIDLGLNNLATLTTNVPGYQPKIYDGRAIKAANQYCHKKNAVHRSFLAKNQFTSARIKRLWHKRNCKVDYYLHTTSRGIINELVSNRIGKLIVGWNRDFKDKINIGKVNNQKLATIPHYRLVEQLKYKGELAGIEVIEHEESYTSKCSALDLEPIKKHQKYQGRRVKRGLFKTAEGKLINADMNGSLNIGRKVVGNGFIPHPIEAVVVQPVRVRPYKGKIEAV